MEGFEEWWNNSFSLNMIPDTMTHDELQAIKKGYEDCWKEAIKYAKHTACTSSL